MPRASVIVVNHNGRGYLEGCLRSLLERGGGEDEVILVDNCSTDGSAEVVEQLFPQIRVIRNEVNEGFGRASNLGARQARGAYLAFLNPDTVVEPGWLEPLLAALNADPQAALVTSKILLLGDPERVNTCGNDVHFTGLTLCRGMGAKRKTFRATAEVSAISGAAFAARREVFEALGGFDESFFLYMEDTDLSLRARLAGYHCLCVPASVVYHDYGLRFGPQKTYLQERNRYLMLLKNLRWGTLALLVPSLLLSEAVTWGFVLLRERHRLVTKLRAYVWVVRHWRGIMEKRRQTQSLRRVRDHDLLAALTHRLAFEQTGDGVVPRLAHLLFDPLFLLLHRLVLLLVRW